VVNSTVLRVSSQAIYEIKSSPHNAFMRGGCVIFVILFLNDRYHHEILVTCFNSDLFCGWSNFRKEKSQNAILYSRFNVVYVNLV